LTKTSRALKYRKLKIKNMNKRLLGDRILIEVESAEEKTASGVYVPTTVQPGDPMIGRIVAVGTGKIDNGGNHRPLTNKVGERVIFEYGKKVKIEGKSYLVVTGDDVILVLEESTS
jgi:chaperonin GroES